MLAAKKERAQAEKIDAEMSALKPKPVVTEKPGYLKSMSVQSSGTYASKNELTQKYY